MKTRELRKASHIEKKEGKKREIRDFAQTLGIANPTIVVLNALNKKETTSMLSNIHRTAKENG